MANRVISNKDFWDCIAKVANLIMCRGYRCLTFYGPPLNGTIVASLLARYIEDTWGRYLTSVVSMPLTLVDGYWLVDDIYDTGATLGRQSARYGGVNSAVLYFRSKSNAIYTPTVVGEVLHHDDYVIFPWEAGGAFRGGAFQPSTVRGGLHRIKEMENKQGVSDAV